MTLDASTAASRIDAHGLAAAARSILACPDVVALAVDGLDEAEPSADGLELSDRCGQPYLACLPDSPLALAADQGRGAVLTVRSGLGPPGSIDRDAVLTLSGHLVTHGLAKCPCCSELQTQVALHLDFVLVAREDTTAPARFRVPLGAFSSPTLDLNRGFLQRSTEHANQCHQDELRRAIAARTATRLGEVLGVNLTDLRPDGVVLQWVDSTGGHCTALDFARTATCARDLGDLLRAELHAGLC